MVAFCSSRLWSISFLPAWDIKMLGLEMGSGYAGSYGEDCVLEERLWTERSASCYAPHQQGPALGSVLIWLPNASWGRSMNDQGDWLDAHCHEQWKASAFSCKAMRGSFAYRPAQSWEPSVWYFCLAREICLVTETEKRCISSMDFWRELKTFAVRSTPSIVTGLPHKAPTEAHSENGCMSGWWPRCLNIHLHSFVAVPGRRSSRKISRMCVIGLQVFKFQLLKRSENVQMQLPIQLSWQLPAKWTKKHQIPPYFLLTLQHCEFLAFSSLIYRKSIVGKVPQLLLISYSCIFSELQYQEAFFKCAMGNEFLAVFLNWIAF